MMISERHRKILEELSRDPEITVRELSARLSVSEPTVRRDFTELHRKGIITKRYGGAILNRVAADSEIPFLLREHEKSSAKSEMGARASELVSDGMVVMLDGSTSAYHLVPYLARYKDLLVITSGAKTAVALAEANIRTFCTGGQMITNSFSYVGESAESFVRKINADILFFSCHGLTDEGMMTERIIEEANLRMTMFGSCKKKVLLCDSSKFGKTCFYNMGSVADIDGVISETALPSAVAETIGKNRK
jgi:DeoR/GlpR family transcriptional regulator of sugar metabolism